MATKKETAPRDYTKDDFDAEGNLINKELIKTAEEARAELMQEPVVSPTDGQANAELPPAAPPAEQGK